MSQNKVKDLRTAFGKFATGVTVISAESGQDVHGMTANSFSSVSMDPPMLLVCVANEAKALHVIVDSKGFGVSVLAEHQKSVSNHFAGKPHSTKLSLQASAGCQRLREQLPSLDANLKKPILPGTTQFLSVG